MEIVKFEVLEVQMPDHFVKIVSFLLDADIAHKSCSLGAFVNDSVLGLMNNSSVLSKIVMKPDRVVSHVTH